ncbi:hypothetical protein IW261DRAFT_148484 [Armillaria novae-zelandiae]|uniref:Uncharacterized protein n=1 Tax=Armillaria novae-zelandiae TaxID=153914 RepID=A0AA39P8N7_9AGAR|nr:hypothetical protein IW261DRAFT_148484 [Armillaria novae-zelandiae]
MGPVCAFVAIFSVFPTEFLMEASILEACRGRHWQETLTHQETAQRDERRALGREEVGAYVMEGGKERKGDISSEPLYERETEVSYQHGSRISP